MPSLYTFSKNLLRKTTGIEFYRANPPWGFSLIQDLRRLTPAFSPTLIFDVGANVGQSAERFRESFPLAKLHCFEPVETTYRQLAARFAGATQVHCHHLALGNQQGQLRIVNSHCSSQTAHIADDSEATDAETVEATTLDIFCAQRAINTIDLLKIDTEGHDLKVLAGAEQMLRRQAVRFVTVETQLCSYHSSRNPGPRHLPVSEFPTYLNPLGYRCLGLHDQEYASGWGIHFGNALFGRIADFP